MLYLIQINLSMGKIYNGMDDINITESDNPNEILNVLNNIGTFVVERDDVKFRDEEIKRIYNIINAERVIL